MCLVSFRIRLGKYKKIEKLGSIYIECPGHKKKTEHALQHKQTKQNVDYTDDFYRRADWISA